MVSNCVRSREKTWKGQCRLEEKVCNRKPGREMVWCLIVYDRERRRAQGAVPARRKSVQQKTREGDGMVSNCVRSREQTCKGSDG